MIKNIDSNQVAVKWILPRNPDIVRIGNTNKYYVFVPKLHIWMAWIDDENLSQVLSTKAKKCNCGNNKTYVPAFEYANLLDVQLWETGGRNELPSNLQEIN